MHTYAIGTKPDGSIHLDPALDHFENAAYHLITGTCERIEYRRDMATTGIIFELSRVLTITDDHLCRAVACPRIANVMARDYARWTRTGTPRRIVIGPDDQAPPLFTYVGDQDVWDMAMGR